MNAQSKHNLKRGRLIFLTLEHHRLFSQTASIHIQTKYGGQKNG